MFDEDPATNEGKIEWIIHLIEKIDGCVREKRYFRLTLYSILAGGYLSWLSRRGVDVGEFVDMALAVWEARKCADRTEREVATELELERIRNEEMRDLEYMKNVLTDKEVWEKWSEDELGERFGNIESVNSGEKEDWSPLDPTKTPGDGVEDG